MFNTLKDYVNYRRCRRLVKCQFEPCDEFLNECRDRFLSKIQSRRNGKISVFSPTFKPVFRYGLVGLFSLIFLSIAAMVYADRQDVSYSHPLYQLKRIGENVRVVFARGGVRPVIYNQLAERRYHECEQMRSMLKESESGQINAEILKDLNRDFHQEVRNILIAVSNNKIESKKAGWLCGSALKMVRGENVSGVDGLERERLQLLDKIIEDCAKFMR